MSFWLGYFECTHEKLTLPWRPLTQMLFFAKRCCLTNSAPENTDPRIACRTRVATASWCPIEQCLTFVRIYHEHVNVSIRVTVHRLCLAGGKNTKQPLEKYGKLLIFSFGFSITWSTLIPAFGEKKYRWRAATREKKIRVWGEKSWKILSPTKRKSNGKKRTRMQNPDHFFWTHTLRVYLWWKYGVC